MTICSFLTLEADPENGKTLTMGFYEINEINGDYFLQDFCTFQDEELIMRCNERNGMIVTLSGAMELRLFTLTNRRFQLLHSLVSSKIATFL